jgi:malate permease and related proteins
VDAFETVLGSVGPVLILVALGWYLGRRGKFDTKPLLDWVIYIGMPALIIHSLSRTPIAVGHLLEVGLGNLFVVSSVVAAALLYGRLKQDREPEVPVCAGFANAANIPLPLALFAFGEIGLSHQIIYMTCNVVLLYTVGVALLSPNRAGWLLVLKLPLVYATAAGILLSLTGTTLPLVVARPIEMLGQTAIPLMLFSLGFTIGGRMGSAFKEVLPIVLLRVVGGGVAGLVYVWFMAPSPVVQRAVLLGAFMPAAVQSYMLSAKFAKNPARAAGAVLVSTLLAALYIPLLILWLGEI